MKLSVITINYNNVTGLGQTMQSVFAQTFKDFEYIIIDGGSTDGSKELIERNKEQLSHWKSESDKGVYHAMNKGINCSAGEYLLFLNSGDELLSNDTLQNVFSIGLFADIVYGDVIYSDKENAKLKKYDAPVTFSYMFKDGLPHQGSFIKKELFEKHGKYDEAIKISADWKFFMRAIFLNNASTQYLNIPIARFDATGLSSAPENADLMLSERRSVLKEYFPRLIEDYQELFDLRNKYKLLINSRYLKTALVIKNFLPVRIIKNIFKGK